MDKEQEYNPDLITVQDDEGNEHIFEELDRIETDQGRYVAMLPTFDSEEEMLESDSELIILKVFEEGDETYLAAIEDDDEFDEVADIFEERLQDIFEIDVVEANKAYWVRHSRNIFDPTRYKRESGQAAECRPPPRGCWEHGNRLMDTHLSQRQVIIVSTPARWVFFRLFAV